MKNSIQALLIGLLTLSFPHFSVAELPIGQSPPLITLQGEAGGRVDGTPWSSSEIKGKVFTLMYVDPDEKEINVHVEKALKDLKLAPGTIGSVAVINMAASWKPNWAINSALEDKQKEFPNTVYVKDMDRTLVKKWNLKDESYDVLLFDKQGQVIFSRDGKLSDQDVATLIKHIKDRLNQ